MFGRLVQKELLNYLLDLRFIVVFALCVAFSVLSVYIGTRNYALQLRGYHSISEANRHALQVWLDEGNWEFSAKGYPWTRRPEALSSLVYGMSGTVGQEVIIHSEKLPEFEGSLFETDPVHALFKVLDLAFMVKVVLSLFVLLFVYDAVCGEKEAGTLRLCASFPVSRPMLALSKLVGCVLAVMVPFLVAFLLVSCVLAMSPAVDLDVEDWGRVAALMGVFMLYLCDFAIFGLWASALAHRRMTAFLALLGLWTLWLFVIPNLAVRVAQSWAPSEGIYRMDKDLNVLRWKVRDSRQEEIKAFWNQYQRGSRSALSDVLQGARQIEEKWDAAYARGLTQFRTERRNQMRRQQRLAMWLSAVSPVGPASYASMDLCRTGFVQQERIEDALNAHLSDLAAYVRGKQYTIFERLVLTDFTPFSYQDHEALGESLSRNTGHVLNLLLLVFLGFAGAYVAILRYDVR